MPTAVATDPPDQDAATPPQDPVWVGVDTHRDVHVAAVCDELGRTLGTASFAATAPGYVRLLAWARGHGTIVTVGVEGTGSWGAALTRYLTDSAVAVVEVTRPDRSARRHLGKSDDLDAQAAARAALTGAARNVPRSRDGAVEAIRALKTARDGAVKARTAVADQLRHQIVAVDPALRARLEALSWGRLIAACQTLTCEDPTDPAQAANAALASMAARWQHLHREVNALNRKLRPTVAAVAPQLTDRPGIGLQSAADLLVTAGDNPHRLANEAAFARLCGVAPLPASSGKVTRHRLSRIGDRNANRALYMIVVTRMRIDDRTRAYVTRRTAQGLSNREIIRCLKRYVAREIYHLLTDPPATAPAT